MRKRVFVSYSHKDYKWAKEVITQLETLGFKTWKDNAYDKTKERIESGIPAGGNWPKEIEHAIEECVGFIGLVSENSLKSEWCYSELLYAQQQTDHVNILIRHREDTLMPKGMRYLYANNSNIVWSETNPSAVWKSVEANSAFWALREGEVSIDEVQSPMVDKINALLKVDREHHQSFQLMKTLDRELLPVGTTRGPDHGLIRNTERMVSDGSGEKKPFGEFIQDSWESQKHLFIEGTGGVGKSVALLTFATEEGFLPINTTAVYIPLYRLADDKFSCDIDRYLKDRYAADEYDWIQKCSKSEWNKHPNLILLLDGYNEIPADYRRDVDRSIDDWSRRRGVQVVTTSRFIATFNNHMFQRIQLLELNRNTVNECLKKNDISPPDDYSNIWNVINTPLMLKIYVDVHDLKRKTSKNYLPFKSSVNAGSLIWNYLLKETSRCFDHKGTFEEIEYAIGLLLITPYIAWWMEKNHRFDITDKEFENLVEEASDYWKARQKPEYFKRMQRRMRQSSHDYVFDNELCILEEECAMFWLFTVGKRDYEEYRYTLLHQNFRDGLAAIHLANVAETCDRTLPEEIKRSFSEYVIDYLANIMEEKTIENTWNINRLYPTTHSNATHNLLRIVHKKNNGNLQNLNWSGMDLTGINLFSYRDTSMKLNLSTDKRHFEGTKMDIECFEQMKYEYIYSFSFSPDGSKIATALSDGTMRIWDAESGQQLGVALEGHTSKVRSAAFSMDGSKIVTGSDDGIVRIWDVESHRQIGESLKRHGGL